MSQVELIVGPAGTGKTAHAHAAFRDELSRSQADGRFGSGLWITPTQRARRHMLRSLLGDGLAVCFAPQVLTFDEFAEQLLRTAPEAVRPLSRVAKRKLLRDLIDDLNRRGRLKFFGAVADTAGFLELCVSFISELKREEVWPEDFEKACRALDDGDSDAKDKKKRGSPKDRELSLIYDAYQRRLHAAGGAKPSREAAAGLYDGEGRFWSARTLMQRGHRGPFRDLSLVVVDGFADFTRTQYEILSTLAGWTERLLLTLPLDPSGGRGDLFAKSQAALGELKKAFGDGHEVREIAVGPQEPFQATAFGRLSAHLFDNPRELPKCGDASGLAVLSCARRTGEIETIAKRVKRLLVGGTPPDDIVVAFRSLDGLADLVRETFAAAGVPAAIETGPPIAQTGAVRFLRSLLDLEREDWGFPRLTGILSSTLFRPDWPGVGDGSAARAAVAALRDFNLEGGREVILQALAWRVERQGEGTAPTEIASLDLFKRLSDELAPLRKRATFAEWVERLLGIASAFRIAPGTEQFPLADRSLALAEEGGWNAFVRLVEEARKAETLAGGPARTLGLAEFRKQLDELLAGQTWDDDEPEDGRVRVLAAEQVRNLDVPHLFLCGLSESSFPQSRGDDCLYGDAERHRLREGGVPVAHRARRSREEMLLFYSVVTRARRRLTLSFPSVDDGGEALYPSPFLSSILDLFTREALPVESCGCLDPVPPDVGECVTESELRVVAAREALFGHAGLFASLADRRESAETALNVAAAAEMCAARFAVRGLTNYEGLLSDPRNIKRLRKRFGAGHEFSATELETYAAHPFRYFLEYVLGLQPLADPGPATDFSRRGMVLHAALAALHRRLAEEVADTVATDALRELLAAEVEAALSRPAGDSPLQRALHRIERQVIAKRAERYAPQWERYLDTLKSLWDGPPKPAHFEIAFGNAPDEEGARREEVRHPVVEFGASGGRVRVRGRIDRIDVGTADGRPVFTVIDYKLGSPPRFADGDVETGRSLQLAVYAAAARRLGIVQADLFQLAFWGLAKDGFVPGIKDGRRKLQPLDADRVAALEDGLDRVLPQLAQAIRAGKFPVVADDPDESFNPDYAAVARTGPFRSVADLLEKQLADEKPLVTEVLVGQAPA